jgi:hypothetical protein
MISARIFHVVDSFGETERHKRARATWETVYEKGVTSAWANVDDFDRNALSLGDTRKLPFFKDLFRVALVHAGPGDVIIWTNGDNGLDPRIIDWAWGHLWVNDAASMRRPDEPGVHVGRDLFGFRAEWLAEHIDIFPDFICGAPLFDIVIAAIIRKYHGINSTLQNMGQDIMPAETSDRFVLHEPHISSWAGPEEHTRPGNIYNRRLAREWAAANMPGLRL